MKIRGRREMGYCDLFAREIESAGNISRRKLGNRHDMAGALCRPGHKRLHPSSFQRMEEFRKVLVRQIVDGKNGLRLHEWREYVLGMENIRLRSGKELGENSTNPYNWILRDGNKLKRRAANVLLFERSRMRIEKIIVVPAWGLRKATQKLAAICFIAAGLTAQTVYVNGNLHQ
jgi:hypothetical protein